MENLNYLEKNGYVQIKYVYNGYLNTAKIAITTKGIRLMENEINRI